MLPDFERADRIGEVLGYPQSRDFAELLIDCEEDRVLRAVLVGMLREASLWSLRRTASQRFSPRTGAARGRGCRKPVLQRISVSPLAPPPRGWLCST